MMFALGAGEIVESKVSYFERSMPSGDLQKVASIFHYVQVNEPRPMVKSQFIIEVVVYE